MIQEPLINPSKEGFTLLMAGEAGTPARFWVYREVPDARVPEFLKDGWATCPFEVTKPKRIIDGNRYQVLYTEKG